MEMSGVKCDESSALLVTDTLKKFFDEVYVINLADQSIEEVIGPEYFEKLNKENNNFSKIVDLIAEKCVAVTDREKLYEFLNIQTMVNRVKDKKFDKQDFMTRRGKWVRAFLMTAEADELGNVKKILFCSQDITNEKINELEIVNREKHFIELYKALCHDYECCGYVILDSNSAIAYKVTKEIQEEYGLNPMQPKQYDLVVKSYIQKAVIPEDREILYEILNADWLHEHLNYTHTVDRTFRVYDQDDFRYWQVRIARTYESEHFSFVIGFGDVDEKIREEMSQKKALQNAYEEAIQLRRGLMSDNCYLFNINLTKDLIKDDIISKSEQGPVSLLNRVGLKAPCSFNEFAKRAIDLIAEEYSEDYKKIENCNELLKAYRSGKESVTIVFGMYAEDQKRIKIAQQTCVFSKAQETGDIICTCFAKDITEHMEKNAILTRERKQYRDALMAQAEFEYEFDLTEGLMTNEFYTKKGINVFSSIGVKPPISYDDYTKTSAKILKEKALGDQNEKYWTRKGLLDAFYEGKRNVEFDYYSGYKDRYYRISFLLYEQSITKHVEVISIGRDITEERKREEDYKRKLAKALENAKRANCAKTMFLTQMSHDIRTPLNGIIGLIEIDQRHPKDMEKMKENREKAMIAAKHLLSLINDVLEISKLDAENAKIEHEAFDIRSLIADTITITETRAIEADIKLIHENNDQDYTIPYVYGSPLHLRQIFLNILGNAIKYNRSGGSVNVKMEIVGIEEKQVIYRYVISDTGIGMSDEFVNSIYEPFSQEHSDARSVYQGTGLGMTITKKLIDMMKGTICVESEVGVGSTFVITIPFDIADESDIAKPTEMTGNIVIKGAKILLVEDNELNMEIAQYLLEDAGANVTSVFNGKQAVETFENNPPGTYDVILMDIMMPVMNGYNAAKEIRNLKRSDAETIPIFAMTANAFKEDIEKAKQFGMNEHLPKPLDSKKVLETIAKYL